MRKFFVLAAIAAVLSFGCSGKKCCGDNCPTGTCACVQDCHCQGGGACCCNGVCKPACDCHGCCCK